MKLTKATLKKLIKEVYEEDQEASEREMRLRRTSDAVDMADDYHSDEEDKISVKELKDGLRGIFKDEKMVEDLVAKILDGAHGEDVDDFVSKRMY
jgi:hypothetical protein